jgi:hypothetical protein
MNLLPMLLLPARFFKPLLIAFLIPLLIACGSDDSSSDDGNSAPQASFGLKATANSTSQITVSWDIGAGDYYEIHRGKNSDAADRSEISSPTFSPYIDTGLEPNTLYYYWVKRCNTQGTCSDFSQVKSAKTLSGPPSNIKLKVNSTSQITVSWDSGAGDYYEIYRATTSNTSNSTEIANKPLDSADNSYIDSTLTENTVYYYWMKACQTGGTCSDFSLPVTTRTFSVTYTWTTATDSATFPVRYNHSSVAFGGKLWVMGGYNDFIEKVTNFDHINDVWNSTNGKTWTPVTSSASFTARNGHQSVVFDKKMWVIGGTDGSVDSEVWHSTNGVTWIAATANAKFSGRQLHSAVVFNDGTGEKMWVIGGKSSGTIKNDVWSSTNGKTWTPVTSSASFTARYGHSSLSFGGKMWVIGGYTGTERFNDVWSSTNGKTWIPVTSSASFTARFEHASEVFDSKMWVFNGFDGGQTSDIWSSANGKDWNQVTDSTEFNARSRHSSVVFKNRVWIIGGLGGLGPSFLNDVWSMVRD